MGKSCTCCGPRAEKCVDKIDFFDRDKYSVEKYIRHIKTTPILEKQERTTTKAFQIDDDGNITDNLVSETDTGWQTVNTIPSDPIFTSDNKKIVVNAEEVKTSDPIITFSESSTEEQTINGILCSVTTTREERERRKNKVETRVAIIFEVDDLFNYDQKDDYDNPMYASSKLSLLLSQHIEEYEESEEMSIRVHGSYFNQREPVIWRQINQQISESSNQIEIKINDYENLIDKRNRRRSEITGEEFQGNDNCWIDITDWNVIKGNGSYMFLVEPVGEGAREIGNFNRSRHGYTSSTAGFQQSLTNVFLEFTRSVLNFRPITNRDPDDPNAGGVEDFESTNQRRQLYYEQDFNSFLMDWHKHFTRTADGVYESTTSFLPDDNYQILFNTWKSFSAFPYLSNTHRTSEFDMQGLMSHFDKFFTCEIFKPATGRTIEESEFSYVDFKYGLVLEDRKFNDEVGLNYPSARWASNNYFRDTEEKRIQFAGKSASFLDVDTQIETYNDDFTYGRRSIDRFRQSQEAYSRYWGRDEKNHQILYGYFYNFYMGDKRYIARSRDNSHEDINTFYTRRLRETSPFPKKDEPYIGVDVFSDNFHFLSEYGGLSDAAGFIFRKRIQNSVSNFKNRIPDYDWHNRDEDKIFSTPTVLSEYFDLKDNRILPSVRVKNKQALVVLPCSFTDNIPNGRHSGYRDSSGVDFSSVYNDVYSPNLIDRTRKLRLTVPSGYFPPSVRVQSVRAGAKNLDCLSVCSDLSAYNTPHFDISVSSDFEDQEAVRHYNSSSCYSKAITVPRRTTHVPSTNYQYGYGITDAQYFDNLYDGCNEFERWQPYRFDTVSHSVSDYLDIPATRSSTTKMEPLKYNYYRGTPESDGGQLTYAKGIYSNKLDTENWVKFVTYTGVNPYTSLANLRTLKAYYYDEDVFEEDTIDPTPTGGAYIERSVIRYSVNWPDEWWRYLINPKDYFRRGVSRGSQIHRETFYWQYGIPYEDTGDLVEEKISENLVFDGQLKKITRKKKFTEDDIASIQKNLFGEANLIYLVTDEEPIEDSEGNILEQNGYYKITPDSHEGPLKDDEDEIIKEDPTKYAALEFAFQIKHSFSFKGALTSLYEHSGEWFDGIGWTPQNAYVIQETYDTLDSYNSLSDRFYVSVNDLINTSRGINNGEQDFYTGQEFISLGYSQFINNPGKKDADGNVIYGPHVIGKDGDPLISDSIIVDMSNMDCSIAQNYSDVQVPGISCEDSACRYKIDLIHGDRDQSTVFNTSGQNLSPKLIMHDWTDIPNYSFETYTRPIFDRNTNYIDERTVGGNRTRMRTPTEPVDYSFSFSFSQEENKRLGSIDLSFTPQDQIIESVVPFSYVGRLTNTPFWIRQVSSHECPNEGPRPGAPEWEDVEIPGLGIRTQNLRKAVLGYEKSLAVTSNLFKKILSYYQSEITMTWIKNITEAELLSDDFELNLSGSDAAVFNTGIGTGNHVDSGYHDSDPIFNRSQSGSSFISSLSRADSIGDFSLVGKIIQQQFVRTGFAEHKAYYYPFSSFGDTYELFGDAFPEIKELRRLRPAPDANGFFSFPQMDQNKSILDKRFCRTIAPITSIRLSNHNGDVPDYRGYVDSWRSEPNTKQGNKFSSFIDHGDATILTNTSYPFGYKCSLQGCGSSSFAPESPVDFEGCTFGEPYQLQSYPFDYVRKGWDFGYQQIIKDRNRKGYHIWPDFGHFSNGGPPGLTWMPPDVFIFLDSNWFGGGFSVCDPVGRFEGPPNFRLEPNPSCLTLKRETARSPLRHGPIGLEARASGMESSDLHALYTAKPFYDNFIDCSFAPITKSCDGDDLLYRELDSNLFGDSFTHWYMMTGQVSDGTHYLKNSLNLENVYNTKEEILVNALRGYISSHYFIHGKNLRGENMLYDSSNHYFTRDHHARQYSTMPTPLYPYDSVTGYRVSNDFIPINKGYYNTIINSLVLRRAAEISVAAARASSPPQLYNTDDYAYRYKIHFTNTVISLDDININIKTRKYSNNE